MPRTVNKRGRWAAVAAAATLVASGMVLTSSTAAQGASPADQCTAAHPRDDAPAYTQDADGWPLSVPGDPGGQVYVFYEPTYGYNCAIVVANSDSAYVDIGLRRSDGGAPQWRDGTGASAGPVLIEAMNVCIDVTAAVGERSLTVRDTNCGA
ncbi:MULTISPECIES: hypothetical protein [unclassified Nocardiopsis]|uniref:hypothetical protein n=1 Tax=unclassified Nocardiopsis TaxID=2649073 RepID=UPI0033DEA49E